MLVVALPLCVGACLVATGSMSPGHLPMGSPTHQAEIPVLQPVCDMVTSTVAAVEKGLAPDSLSLVLLVTAALAGVASMAIVPRPAPLAAVARSGAPPGPPGEQGGVRLLI